MVNAIEWNKELTLNEQVITHRYSKKFEAKNSLEAVLS